MLVSKGRAVLGDPFRDGSGKGIIESNRPDAAKKSLELVSSPDRQYRVAPGGHMGVLSGARAQAAVWQVTADWLGGRSAIEIARAPERVETERRIRRRKRLSDDPGF